MATGGLAEEDDGCRAVTDAVEDSMRANGQRSFTRGQSVECMAAQSE